MLCDPKPMAGVVGALTPAARRLAAEAAFLDEGVVRQSRGGRVGAEVAELERHGIVFTFRGIYNLEHWVPSELRPLLAAALAAPYAGGLAAAGRVATAPARWLEAPLQLAHDIASLWAYLARSPVRVKADGIVYQRDVPKLFDALPPFELHGPHDVMEGHAWPSALALMRDERLVRVRVDDRPERVAGASWLRPATRSRCSRPSPGDWRRPSRTSRSVRRSRLRFPARPPSPAPRRDARGFGARRCARCARTPAWACPRPPTSVSASVACTSPGLLARS